MMTKNEEYQKKEVRKEIEELISTEDDLVKLRFLRKFISDLKEDEKETE